MDSKIYWPVEVGGTFDLDGARYRVVEGWGCSGCACVRAQECSPHKRPDRTSVCFVPEPQPQRRLNDATPDEWTRAGYESEPVAGPDEEGGTGETHFDPPLPGPATVRYAARGDSKPAEEHSHYKRSVAGLDFIDPYRIIDLYGITHPGMQHILKKVLIPGGRGHKDFRRDLQDVFDTAQRSLEMLDEDNKRATR